MSTLSSLPASEHSHEWGRANRACTYVQASRLPPPRANILYQCPGWSCAPAPEWSSSKILGPHQGSPGSVFRIKSGLLCLAFAPLQGQALVCFSVPPQRWRLGSSQATCHCSLNSASDLVPSGLASPLLLYFVIFTCAHIFSLLV